MNYREMTVDVVSDYFPDNNDMHEYLGNNLVQALVSAKWEENTREYFHPHGSTTSTFQRLILWELMAIKLNGAMLVNSNTPSDFPLDAIAQVAASDAYRNKLERGT